MILAVVMAMIAICIVAFDDSLVDYLAKLKNNSDNFIFHLLSTYDHLKKFISTFHASKETLFS